MTCQKSLTKLEKSIAALNSAIEKERPFQIKTKEQIAHLEKQVSEAKAKEEKLKEKQNSHAQTIADLETEVKNCQRAYDGYLAEIESENRENKGFKLASSQLDEYQALKAQAASETAAAREDLDKNSRALAILDDQVSSINSHITTLTERKRRLEEELIPLRERQADFSQQLKDTQAELKVQEAEMDKIRQANVEAKQKREDLGRELVAIQGQVLDAQSDARQSERERRILDALESMKAHFPGKVRGRIVDLCSITQKKYNIAVTIALGKNMEAVVVEDQKTAIECIQYMKDKRIGVLTFIPLDVIKTKPKNESLNQLGGTFKLLIDVIDFDPSLERALLYCCSNTLVCDDIDEARKLCYGKGSRSSNEASQYKVVTTNGTIIHKSGNLTGGVGKYHSKAKQWNDKELAQAREKKDAIYGELKKYEKLRADDDRMNHLGIEIESLKRRLNILEMDMKTTKSKIDSREGDLKSIDPQIKAKQKELAKLLSAKSTKENEVKDKTDSMAKIEDKLFARFSAKVGVANIREFEENRLSNAQKQQEKKLELSNQLSRVNNQLEYERKRDMAKNLKGLTEKLKTDQKTLQSLISKQDKKAEEVAKKQSELESLTEEVAAENKKMEDIKNELKVIKREANQILTQTNQIDQQIATKEGQVETLSGNRKELVRRCKLDSITLPFLKKRASAAGKKRKERSGKSKSKAKKKAKNTKRNEEAMDDSDDDQEEEMENENEEIEEKVTEGDADDLPLDFSALKVHRDIKSASEFEKVKASYQSKIVATQSELDKLAPNLRAIERFDDVKQRLQGSVTVWEEKKAAVQQAMEAFEAIKTQRHEKFMEAFNHISAAIDGIYKSLTQSDQCPFGGKASLQLENNQDPYLHGVKFTAMPPMKTLRGMEQLSGGERTVAALALLFAIHSFHPSPFFVLDEVDAALDNVNVTKVSNFIRSKARTDHLQCIVISLKDTFFTKADGLVGVYRNQEEESSGTLTLDLTTYDKAAN